MYGGGDFAENTADTCPTFLGGVLARLYVYERSRHTEGRWSIGAGGSLKGAMITPCSPLFLSQEQPMSSV